MAEFTDEDRAQIHAELDRIMRHGLDSERLEGFRRGGQETLPSH